MQPLCKVHSALAHFGWLLVCWFLGMNPLGLTLPIKSASFRFGSFSDLEDKPWALFAIISKALFSSIGLFVHLLISNVLDKEKHILRKSFAMNAWLQSITVGCQCIDKQVIKGTTRST